MWNSGGVGIAGAVRVNEGCVKFHVGSGGPRTLVLVRNADVVGSTVLRDGCRHAVVVDRAVHASTARKEAVVGGVRAVCTALAFVGAVPEVGIRGTAGAPGPVVGRNGTGSSGVGGSKGRRHVGDVDVFIGVVHLDGVVGIRASTLLRAVSAIVRGDVLSEHDVTRAGGLGWVVHNGFFLQFGDWRLIEFRHHSGCETTEKNGHDDQCKATR